MILRDYAPSQNDLDFNAIHEANVQLIKPGWATFSVFCRNLKTGDFFQRSYPIEQLHLRLPEFAAIPEHDIYIVQNLFQKYNRRSLLLNRICACYVDLDLYHIDPNRAPESWVDEILEHCWKNEIPQPSSIIGSGRGLYLKWYLKKGVPPCALSKWNKIQLEIVNQFESFAADRKARDASRVLRILWTINHKSGRRVETLWLNGSPEDVHCYELRELGDSLLPYTEAQIQKFRRQAQWRKIDYRMDEAHKKKGLIALRGSEEWEAILCARQLSFGLRGHHVFEDLWRLAILRGWDVDGIPDGERMNFVLWLCNHAALALNGAERPLVYMEVACFLKALVPHWNMNKIHSGLSEVYKRSKAMMTPQGWLEYEGKMYPALYTPKNSSLIEWLKITDEELDSMKYIRDDASYARKKTRERREQGVLLREDYLTQSKNRKSLALDLRSEGVSLNEIAKILKVSERTVRNYFS